MEFIAGEIKEFESDPVVQNALLMIDWGTRKINLFLVSDPKETDFVTITRDVQWKALLPHSLKHDNQEYQATKLPDKVTKSEDRELGFTVVEAKIRDTYDIFLTRLDRFATFIKSNLIDPGELRPFIDYWIDAITETENLKKDAAWKLTLLTYINYYNYSGVKELFKECGKDLSPEAKVYTDVMMQVQDKTLADRLYKSISSRN